MQLAISSHATATADRQSYRSGQPLSDDTSESALAVLPDYMRHDAMRDELEKECSEAALALAERVPQGAAAFCDSLDSVLEVLRAPIWSRLPSKAATVDYAPYIAAIQRLDDLFAAAAEISSTEAENAKTLAPGTSARRTRNSLMSREPSYVRWLPFSDDEMQLAREAGLQA